MVTDNNETERTHIVYSVDFKDKTLTKIGFALVDHKGDYVFDINKEYSGGDILLYRKSVLINDRNL